jgi:hypothetical protein
MEPEAERERQPLDEEVDLSLLDWYRQLSVTERLRAASKSAATLERLRRAASTDR